jgi:hypothetical protein
VIHVRGPKYLFDDDPPAALALAIQNVIELADRSGLARIAVPAISTGVYGFPMREAAEVLMRTAITLSGECRNLEEVRFVVTNQEAAREFLNYLVDSQSFDLPHDPFVQGILDLFQSPPPKSIELLNYRSGKGFGRIWNDLVVKDKRDELPRFLHFRVNSWVMFDNPYPRGVYGTLVLEPDGYVGKFLHYRKPDGGEFTQDVVPVSLSRSKMQQFLSVLGEQNLTNEEVPEPDWAGQNFARCFAFTVPMQRWPYVFEYRSLGKTTNGAPWDFVAYPGWTRDPDYAREHNIVWSVEGGADRALGFLIDQLGINRQIESLELA